MSDHSPKKTRRANAKPIDPETGEKRTLTRLEEMQEEARINPIWFLDGTSNQEILPIGEQLFPKDKYGKDEGDYDAPVLTPEQEEAAEELLRHIRSEQFKMYTPDWIAPSPLKKDEA